MISIEYTHIYDEKLARINDKLMAIGKAPKTDVELNFDDYKRLDDERITRLKGMKLSNLDVTIIQTNEKIKPFDNWKTETPAWWTSYNRIKHQGTFDDANLDNAINALAALFLLICIKKHSIKMINYGYLCINPMHKRDIIGQGMTEKEHDIITKLFISPIRS